MRPRASPIRAAIESPIREEMRRLSRDMTRSWQYMADQIPVPKPKQDETPREGRLGVDMPAEA